jgi:single-stranded-DNA-specific exonuclease
VRAKTSRPKAARALPPPTASEAAFERLLASFDEERSEASAFVDALFAAAPRYLERERYANLGDAVEFNTKLAGVSFEGRQDIAAGLAPGARLALRREPQNVHDPNAIAVFYGTLQVGFLNREMAAKLAPLIDADGRRYAAEVTAITGGTKGRSYGINVRVRREDVVRGPARAAPAGARPSGEREVRQALIGDHAPREAQALAVERVQAGRNTLAVMGTGRGKSFCFQYPAALAAIRRGAKTLVIYPLRALANDQFEAMERRLGGLGLRILRANGAIDGEERSALMSALEDGAWDFICSTPEFVEFHLERFSAPQSRPSLLVIDEGHHLYESRNRPAYGKLAEIVARLGSPQILALTATAAEAAFEHLRRELSIETWVIDATVRENLHVVDARETEDKEAYLIDVLREGGKAIVYCNSRSGATGVAERLRVAFGNEVAFYHAGMGASERSRVEDYFRDGSLRVVVATSAFGEGIDLPDVRSVFLYHLSFDFTQFNQQAGRAGRDGADARIHLLFGRADKAINEYLIECEAPRLETLREIYRALKSFARDGVVRVDNDTLVSALDSRMVKSGTIAVALRIFADAGLAEVGLDEDGRFVRLVDVHQKVDLTRNTRFAEGEAERESFEKFCSLVLTAPASTLERIINRPIYPHNVPLVK